MPRKLRDSVKLTTSSGVHCVSLFPAMAVVKNNLRRVSLVWPLHLSAPKF